MISSSSFMQQAMIETGLALAWGLARAAIVAGALLFLCALAIWVGSKRQ